MGRSGIVSLVIAMVASGCGPTLVANAPRNVVLGQRYAPEAVRDAVARAVRRRKLLPQSESPGLLVAVGTRKGTTCAFSITWSDRGVSIASAAPGPGGELVPAAMVDESCVSEANAIAKLVGREVERPANEARKEERALRRHELAVESARAAAEGAALAREQLEAQQQQQQQQQPQDAIDPNAAVDPNAAIDPSTAPAAAAPAPATINYQTNNVVSNSTSNTRIESTTINNAPAPEAAAPPINPLLCCKGGQPWVCPDVRVYAAACVQDPRALPRACRLDAAQARYCK